MTVEDPTTVAIRYLVDKCSQEQLEYVSKIVYELTCLQQKYISLMMEYNNLLEKIRMVEGGINGN